MCGGHGTLLVCGAHAVLGHRAPGTRGVGVASGPTWVTAGPQKFFPDVHGTAVVATRAGQACSVIKNINSPQAECISIFSATW